MNRIIVTVLGKDRVGIIAKVCNYMAENSINILNLSQSIIDGMFNMMMIVDTALSDKDLTTIQKELSEVGESIGQQIKAQKEEIFEKMHRI